MPLLDLFKKSPKKEPNKNDLFGTPEMQKKRHDAAMEFLKIFQERMPLVGGKPHAGTVLSIAARLAGTSLFRAINKNDFPAGNVVLSEEVNQAYPQLLSMFAFYCKQNGIDVMAKPTVTQFPEKDKPLMNVEQVLQEYQDNYHEIMKKFGLDYLEGARAGMIVCSIVFQYHCAKIKDIDPYVASGIIAMGIVEGAKTAPPPLGSKPRANIINTSRLVLGEQNVVREEALATGAIYIEMHPEVLKMLQQKSIDPYLIYEEGVRKQIEAKISRIDFIGTNVDEALQIWDGKPQTQTPIHVRLAQWLKVNAKIHGYEQIGNSWVLK